jgi:hypothetical protein
MTEMNTFELKVQFGNEAMQSPEDLAYALRQLADGFETWQAWPSIIEEGRVRDLNGNTVGEWVAT